MPFPANEDTEPDQSQIAWPGRQGERGRRGSTKSQRNLVQEERSGSRPSLRANATKPRNAAETEGASGKKRMSTLDLIYLSISMGGSQVAWTVELG